MDNKCKICGKPLLKLRSKTCDSNLCKSKWKMQRNKNLSPVSKICKNLKCSKLFETVDRRNNFCSSKCKSNVSNQTKISKYGTLNLESKESVQNRVKKLIKPKIKCKVPECSLNSRSNGFCSKHYIKLDYLQTTRGREIYRLGTLRRRDAETGKILTKAELDFIRIYQPKCAKCGTDKNLSLDHHIPLKKGGALELNNTVVLCTSCNSSKNCKDPNEFYNLEELKKIEKYFDFVKSFRLNLKKVYFLFGCFGSGKTWVSNQLTDFFEVIDYDVHRKNSINIINALNTEKPILYVSPVMVTPFLNKYSMTYNICSIALLEDLDVIKDRLKLRNGKFTPSVERRHKRIEVISKKYSDFSGNSKEVLTFLKSKIP